MRFSLQGLFWNIRIHPLQVRIVRSSILRLSRKYSGFNIRFEVPYQTRASLHSDDEIPHSSLSLSLKSTIRNPFLKRDSALSIRLCSADYRITKRLPLSDSVCAVIQNSEIYVMIHTRNASRIPIRYAVYYHRILRRSTHDKKQIYQ